MLVKNFSFAFILFLSFKIPAQSIYQVKPWIDGSIIVGSATATLLPYVFADNLIRPHCPCDSAEVNSFDRDAIGNRSTTADVLSDITVGLSIVVPITLSAIDLNFTDEFWEDTVVFAEALALNGLLVTATKYIVQRPLPRTYEGDPTLINGPQGYRSFYSGHTSLVFAALSAAAMTSNLRHHSGIWPWVLAGGIGTSVAIERVLAGRHFPTDVIVGAFAGIANGVLVPWLHRREETPSANLSLIPIPNGLQAVWSKAL